MAHGLWPHTPEDEGWIPSLAPSRLSFEKAGLEYINRALLHNFHNPLLQAPVSVYLQRVACNCTVEGQGR